MIYNYHCHTKRCNHATGEDREYIEASIQAGVKVLGFSDHAPYDFPFGRYPSIHRMPLNQITEYAESVRALQKEYAKDIRILCGFELEYYPRYHEREMQFLRQVQPDYLILGQHFLGHEEEFRPTTQQKTDEALTEYVNQALQGLETGDFLYLAHPDLAGLVCRAEVWDKEYRRLCEEKNDFSFS